MAIPCSATNEVASVDEAATAHKATVVFKGREITYKEKGEELLARLTEKLIDIAKVDQAAHMEGRSMIMIFAPERKKKAEPKPEEAQAKE